MSNNNISKEPKRSLLKKISDDIVHHKYLIFALTVYFGLAIFFIPPLMHQLNSWKSISKNISGINYINNKDRSISFGNRSYAEMIPSDSIPKLLYFFDCADKLAEYCNTNSTPDLERVIGNICGYELTFRHSYEVNMIIITYDNINVSIISNNKSEYFVKVLTTERNYYYDHLTANIDVMIRTNTELDKITEDLKQKHY